MPHLFYHPPEPIPPIPPRTRSRPPSQTILSTTPSFFRLNDLPSPDHEWQLFENIGDGTYGEVFRVIKFKTTKPFLFLKKFFF
jgi:hypothetical protein